MVKVMFFLYRRSDLTVEAFQRYSKEVHTPLVTRIPGVDRYVVDHVIANPTGAAHACDAVAEFWLGSMESFQTAFATPEVAVVLADQANFLDTGRTHFLIVEESIVR